MQTKPLRPFPLSVSLMEALLSSLPRAFVLDCVCEREKGKEALPQIRSHQNREENASEERRDFLFLAASSSRILKGESW